ncbi:MAG TPA: glycoside hydrolase family 3 N-terminal domain-containing protein [Methylocella sp.]|nr:glycoside hydrolase family 3 N-terminal domain-containing protein [Methylocella sp.]
MDPIASLLGAMTLEEKIGQLNMVAAGATVTGPVLASGTDEDIRAGRIGSLLNLSEPADIAAMQAIAVNESRLGIPLLFGFDVLHGLRTIFPIPLAEAASFDRALWEKTARAAAAEAQAAGIHLVFAPMLDIARDPRWGRMAEGPGEDPFVGAEFAKAKVRGFQGGDGANRLAIAATAKHFCAYGAALAGRDYASADVSPEQLHDVYLPPFTAAVAAGCAAIMPAFNDLNGVPMTVHGALLRDWLRGTIGFEGVILSDYHAIAELLNHGVAGDLMEAAAKALTAGIDIDMMSDAYRTGLPRALAFGLIAVEDIDAAVRRVLALKERLGLFDPPEHRQTAVRPAASRPTALDRDQARAAGRASIVLLTNDGVLPLSKSLRRVALIGPLAEARADMLGPWALAGRAENSVTIREGLTEALPQTEIAFAPGTTIAGGDLAGFAEAQELGRRAEIIVLCVGEAAAMSGEAASRANPNLPGVQNVLAESLFGLGKPVVVVLSCGRPLMLGALADKASAVLATWFLGVEAGHAIADVLTGACNPSARLPVTWPREIGQVPIFFAERPSGRPANRQDRYTSQYLDLPVEPLFPFGHGKGYSRFTLQELRVKEPRFKRADELIIEIKVTNEGPMAGEETIFLFIRDVVASVARPSLELKDFARIRLAAGERGTVQMRLAGEAFTFTGVDLTRVFEPGEFWLYAGASADRRALLACKVHGLPG